MVWLLRHRQTKGPETDRPRLNHRARSRLYPIAPYRSIAPLSLPLFLKELYKALPDTPNIVLVLVMAGISIPTQLTFIIFFRSRLSALQWTGIALLATGAILAST